MFECEKPLNYSVLSPFPKITRKFKLGPKSKRQQKCQSGYQERSFMYRVSCRKFWWTILNQRKSYLLLKRWGNEENVVVSVSYLIKNCPWHDLTTTAPIKNNPCKLSCSAMILKVVVDRWCSDCTVVSEFR